MKQLGIALLTIGVLGLFVVFDFAEESFITSEVKAQKEHERLVSLHAADSLHSDSLGQQVAVLKFQIHADSDKITSLSHTISANRDKIANAAPKTLDSIATSNGLSVTRDTGGRYCFEEPQYRHLLELQVNSGLQDSTRTLVSQQLTSCLHAELLDSSRIEIHKGDALRFKLEGDTLAPQNDSLRGVVRKQGKEKYWWGAGGFGLALLVKLALTLL